MIGCQKKIKFQKKNATEWKVANIEREISLLVNYFQYLSSKLPVNCNPFIQLFL